MNNEQIIHYKNRAYSYGYRLTRNREDAEDFASYAIEDLLRKIKSDKPIDNFNFDFCLKEAIRKHFGRRGSTKEHNRICRGREIKIDPASFDERHPGTISEELIRVSGSSGNYESATRVDNEIIGRLDQGLLGDKRTMLQIANEFGVSESRVSQIVKKDAHNFMKAYLWEHYKEYGIESEIEINWITL